MTEIAFLLCNIVTYRSSTPGGDIKKNFPTPPPSLKKLWNVIRSNCDFLTNCIYAHKSQTYNHVFHYKLKKPNTANFQKQSEEPLEVTPSFCLSDLKDCRLNLRSYG